MNRHAHRMCMAAAASMILVTGAAPTWAHEGAGGRSTSPEVKGQKRESRAARRTMARIERDMNRIVARLNADTRDAVQPHMDALMDLAESDYTSDDVDALITTFEMSLEEAAAAAMSEFSEMAAKRRADLASKGASEKTLARVDAMIERWQSRLERRVEKLQERFDDRVAELFPDYQMESDDGESSDGCDDHGSSPPNEEHPPGQSPPPAPEPAPLPGPEPEPEPEPRSGDA